MLKKILSKLDNRHLTSIFIIIKDNRTYIQTTYYNVMSSDALEKMKLRHLPTTICKASVLKNYEMKKHHIPTTMADAQ